MRDGASRTPTVGREAEVRRLEEFLQSTNQAFVLVGEAGIGKTTLWEAGIAAARAREMRVLRARASDADAQLSFAALSDLLDGIEAGALTGVPPPQLHALEVALLRVAPDGGAPGAHAIALGLLNALRSLGADAPILVAVDDVHWLDPLSAQALAFAVRRLEDDPVKFLISRRSGRASVLEEAFDFDGLERLELASLSLGATRRLLSDRLGLVLPRRVLNRVFELAQGNPLFALELGLMLADRDPAKIGTEIPVPDAIEDLLGSRIAGLTRPIRKLLLAVALSADLRTRHVQSISGADALADAVDAGVLLVDGDRVRASHPMLAATAKAQASRAELLGLHRELAEVIEDEDLRARHLALATEGADPGLAAIAAAAARRVSMRGGTAEAVELAREALRLTPAEAPERPERVLALGEALEVEGNLQTLGDLMASEVEAMPYGAIRGRAQLLLALASVSLAGHEAHLQRALDESANDPTVRARVLGSKAVVLATVSVARISDAEGFALEALPVARLAGPEEERRTLYELSWPRVLRGRPVDDLNERFNAVSDAAFHIHDTVERVAAVRLAWRGEVKEARDRLSRLLALADERGETESYVGVRINLCELELRAGALKATGRLLEEWEGLEEGGALGTEWFLRFKALYGALCGVPDEARRLAESVVLQHETEWNALEAKRAAGIAALRAHGPDQAADSLRAVWEHTEREGVEDPGAFPVAPDLVEALVELGEYDEARAVTERLRKLADEQSHPWGKVTARRCGALLRVVASAAYDERAGEELAKAASAYADLGLRFDSGRTLLSLGRAQRRHRKRAAARKSLERAAAVFEEIGSPGWAEEARVELGRISARKPRPSGELTPSERRVVDLAADGKSNKEIAQELFVSVHTVEVHLSHAYEKLGIRSRAQLARRLSPSH